MKGPVIVSALAAREIAPHFDAAISIIGSRDSGSPLPAGPPGQGRLVLAFDDIEAPMTGFVPPQPGDVRRAIDFARAWVAGDLLLHCTKGISRSPALALVILADWYGMGAEDEAVARLHELCPKAAPNRLVVDLGDKLLRRNGELTRTMLNHPALAHRLALKDAWMWRRRRAAERAGPAPGSSFPSPPPSAPPPSSP